MHPDRIRAAWKLANLKADELLYDLNSGGGIFDLVQSDLPIVERWKRISI
jgi:hypothetical protein